MEIELSELPFLRSLCWQGEKASIAGLSEVEILQLYERNWHYRGATADLSETERQFVQQLAQHYQSWLINNVNVPLHNQILEVLKSLKSELFEQCHIYCRDGTLSYSEYRLCRDIDFLCTYGEDFSRLRRAIYDDGINALFNVPMPHELKSDQYGVRTSIIVSGAILKFEIVAEGRITLDPPNYPKWSPVPCLSVIDQIAEKLLANGDRWADASVDSRDLIDLAMLKLRTEFPQTAIDKAEAAYPCVAPLKRAILNFQAQPEYRMRCYDRLAIQTPSEVVDGLDRLARQFNLSMTERIAIERS